MSKRANIAELRTAVYFKKVVHRVNGNGFPIEEEQGVFGEGVGGKGVPVMCKWNNAHGSEAWSASQLELREPATLTTRYSPLLDDAALILYRENDPEPYEVISNNNVEQRNTWLEIRVQRKVAAR